jgi:hypothetical protein
MVNCQVPLLNVLNVGRLLLKDVIHRGEIKKA